MQTIFSKMVNIFQKTGLSLLYIDLSGKIYAFINEDTKHTKKVAQLEV